MTMDVCARTKGQLAAGILVLVVGIALLAGIHASLAQSVTANARSGQAGSTDSPPLIIAHATGGRVARTPDGRPGIIITLTDSQLKTRPGHQANEGLILDSDLQSIVRSLRSAGAKSVYICGQLIGRETRIRAWGNNITVHNFSMGRPFVIRALGDPEALRAVVEAGNGTLARLRHVDPTMITIQASDRFTLPTPLSR